MWNHGFFILAILFLINRGLAIWDDYHNLPIVSTIAAGQFPPRFYLNPDLPLDYHYGLHVFAASLVRVGGLFSWSAFDAAKSLSTALTLILAWSWFRRFTKNPLALTAGVMLVFLAAGSRRMLLFLPESVLQRISAGIVLHGSAMQTAPDLYSALTSPWNIQGDGPFPFPFAFASGTFSPLSIALTGSGAIPEMTLFLLLLLAKRTWRP